MTRPREVAARPATGLIASLVLTLLVAMPAKPTLAQTTTDTALFVTNGFANTISRVSSAGGTLSTIVPAGSGGLLNPQKLVFGPDGMLYVSSFGRAATSTDPAVPGNILRYDPRTGAFLDVFVPAGAVSGGLRHPNDLVVGPDNRLYVSDPFGSGLVLRFNASTGAFAGALPRAGSPFDLAFGPDGLLYVVVGTSDASIVRYNPATGTFVDRWIPFGSGLTYPAGLSFGPDGHLYIGIGGVDGLVNEVLRIDSVTRAITTFTVPVPGIGPRALTDIAFGPDGHLYVTGFVDGSVLRYNGTTGAFMNVFATGSFGLTGLAFTPRVGETAADPVMPQSQVGNTFMFAPLLVRPNVIFWFDPPAVVGYDYAVTSGPNVRSLVVPPIGDGLFELYLFNETVGQFVFSGLLGAGTAHDFGPAGVNRFRVLGIEDSAGLSPSDPRAFPTGLTFVAAGEMSLEMTAIEAPGPARVPAVVGLTQAAAEAALVGAGLTVGTVTEVHSNTVPAGRVIHQGLVAGASVDRGTAVDLVVSLGSAPVAVPDVVGRPQADAQAAIAAAGLTLGTVTTAPSSTVPAGHVISQQPPAGTMVAPGSAVDLVVSSGPPPVAVPDVVGRPQADAQAAIAAAGLTLGTVTTAPSSTVPAGHVISQQPPAGTMVAPGSAVDLVVSSGPPPVAVPDVVGRPQADAQAAIAAAGLTLGTVTTAPSSTVPAGHVISQQPPAGTMVAPGSAVDLVVSSGPPPVAVPDVVGRPQADAQAAIAAAGLTLGTVTTASSGTVPAGHVISQQPPAGTMVAPGSAVDLVVSSGGAGGFAFSGFFRPVQNPPTVNVVQAGRAVPLKFSLLGDHGLDVVAAGYPRSVAITCVAGMPAADAVDEVAPAGRSGLSYDAATDTYTYVWKTERAWANSCRQLVLRLIDGSEHLALFRFER